MSVHIGFTGTRDGMTPAQQSRAGLLLLELGATDLHHGDCCGADDHIDQIGRELGLMIHLHPPIDPTRRAWCNFQDMCMVYAPKRYLERNQDIVNAVSAMIATPKEMTETLRSGTWSTIRYCRRQGKPLYVVWPDGTVTTENV